jgi:vacuolar protein sorting-associated protein 13A/C
MAKRFLLNLLIERLGQYVEGLTEENLRVGVLSGRIELKNLKLKASALDDLDIPVEVSHGTLRSLKLEVPWASLDRKPVKVSTT